MGMKDIGFYIITGLPLVLAAILFVRILQYKRQLRLFAERIRKRREEDMNQIVTVEYFDRDVTGLAVALNEYTDMIKEKTYQIEAERKKLKNVIAGISHDFRTPLTSAKGYMQLVKKNAEIDEKSMEYIDIAIAKTDYLKTLSDAFFEASQVEAMDEAPELKEINITKLFSDICLGQYGWISERGLETEFNVPSRDFYVTSNKELLSRIFENLFSNAAKYSETYLSIDIGITEDGLRISFINDTEKGADIDIEHVFDAFYRDASRQKEGAGLGLYIVKLLADKLNHGVEAEFADGVFKINLKFYTFK